MLLKDKVVIVSGVGPGMGQALARIAAAEGARAVLMMVSDYSRVVSGASLDVNGGQWMAP